MECSQKRSWEQEFFLQSHGYPKMSLSIVPFNGVEPTEIVQAVNQAGCEVLCIQFRCEIAPARSSQHDHWLRLQAILSQPSVYKALGIFSLPNYADFGYSRSLEVIGTLANLLNCGGGHLRLVEGYDSAMAMARLYLDRAFLRNYSFTEAYSSHVGWCDWFYCDGLLDETVLIGNNGDWWLLMVSSTD